ncbi:hypothetical protein ABLE91_08515 [Aquabacter sp. CN5-332]|uniref:hypothetical protein n=1 Tax=Aquabacter sp. CN5-332 TaxID=3156608 RepID=UPI0032B4EEC0
MKLLDQLSRYLVCYVMIHNYYAWRLGAGPVPTLSALQRTVEASPRQTAGFVAALKAGRLVIAEPDPDDRRIKLLRPSPEMINEIGRSVRTFVAAAEALEGRAPTHSALLETNPEALGDLLRRSAAYVLEHGTLIHPFPRVLHFARRDCGYLLLCAVICTHYAQTLPGTAPALPLSYRALAERFQVSPAHIGNLVCEAEREGWFSTGTRGQLTVIDAGFLDEFERWASWQMVHYLALADETTASFAGRQAAAG